MNLADVQKTIAPVLAQHNLQYAGVFGSVARGEQRHDSDVDILIKFNERPTFDAYYDLHEALRHALKRDIDLVTEGSVNKHLRPYIEQDLRLVYGQR